MKEKTLEYILGGIQERFPDAFLAPKKFVINGVDVNGFEEDPDEQLCYVKAYVWAQDASNRKDKSDTDGEIEFICKFLISPVEVCTQENWSGDFSVYVTIAAASGFHGEAGYCVTVKDDTVTDVWNINFEMLFQRMSEALSVLGIFTEGQLESMYCDVWSCMIDPADSLKALLTLSCTFGSSPIYYFVFDVDVISDFANTHTDYNLTFQPGSIVKRVIKSSFVNSTEGSVTHSNVASFCNGTSILARFPFRS